MKERKTCVGIGEILWDVFPAGKKLGGAVMNFAYHMNSLGHRGMVVSAVGKDPNGDEILEIVKNAGMTTQYIPQLSEYPTGIVTVELDSAGKPCYDIKQDVAWDNVPLCDGILALADDTDVVCFGSLAQRQAGTKKTITQFVKKVAGRAGTLRVFDINLRGNFYDESTIHDSLECANVLKLNDEEISTVADMFGLPHNPDEFIGAAMGRFGLDILALTCGGDGAFLANEAERVFLPCPQTDIVDTVGAGDSFTAGMVAGLLAGWDLKSVLHNAQLVASYVCSQPGGTPNLTEEIRRIYSA